MGSLYYKNKTYGGNPQTLIQLTKAQYNQLTEEEKQKEIIYMITDEDSSESVSISDVVIDDSNSVPSNKAVYNALQNVQPAADGLVFEGDSETEDISYISDNTNSRITKLETAALYCDTTNADRGDEPMTSADLLGGKYSADDIEKLSNHYSEAHLLYRGTLHVGDVFSLSEPITNYKVIRMVNETHNYEERELHPCYFNQALLCDMITYWPASGETLLITLGCGTDDGITYTCVRHRQINLTTSVTWNSDAVIQWAIYGLK